MGVSRALPLLCMCTSMNCDCFLLHPDGACIDRHPHLPVTTPCAPPTPGEDLPTAVLREVREETGVETEFLSLLCFRHMRSYRYGCSDIYFICLLKPVGGAAVPQANQDEIHECKWMDVSEQH